MLSLWNRVNDFNVRKEMKSVIFIFLSIMKNAAIGAVAWMAVGRIFLPEIEWLLCFVGYPAIFMGLFGGMLNLYNNEFS